MASKGAGVKRFLYVSTSSVYGVSDAPEVTENHPFVPLTDYNKYKGLCEPILLRHQAPGFVTTIIRPATVCGYSPRMRFDLTVNILTNHAVRKGVITVLVATRRGPTSILRTSPIFTCSGWTCRMNSSLGKRSMRGTRITRLRSLPSWCDKWSRRSIPIRRQFASRNCFERSPLLSGFLAQDCGEAGLEASTLDQGCRSRLVPRVQTRQIPRQHDERQLHKRPRRQKTRPQMIGTPDDSRPKDQDP